MSRLPLKHICSTSEIKINKRFLLLLVLLGIASIISLTVLQSPTLNDIVHETHKKFNDFNPGAAFKAKDKRRRPAEDELDKTYLELLGFVPKPTLFPNRTYKHINPPVIVTGATSDNYDNSLNVLTTVRFQLPNYTFVIYDLGLGSYETLKVKERCSPEEGCILRHFDFNKFPAHIKNYMHTQAFLPCLLQLALTDYGSLIWVGMDTDEHFISGNLTPYMNQANHSGGLLGWPLSSRDPTSFYTHPSMFAKFDTLQERYHFHKMMDTSHLVLINIQAVHKQIMLPWIRCCLSWSCLSPLGAEAGRICNPKRPRYLYSGCHRFASSALNIILGKFDDNQPYLALHKSELFGKVQPPDPMLSTQSRTDNI